MAKWNRGLRDLCLSVHAIGCSGYWEIVRVLWRFGAMDGGMMNVHGAAQYLGQDSASTSATD